ANHDGDFRREPARDTPTSPLDSWERIPGQEIVELLEIDVESVSNCRQIINRQCSSYWRIKLCWVVRECATATLLSPRTPVLAWHGCCLQRAAFDASSEM